MDGLWETGKRAPSEEKHCLVMLSLRYLALKKKYGNKNEVEILVEIKSPKAPVKFFFDVQSRAAPALRNAPLLLCSWKHSPGKTLVKMALAPLKPQRAVKMGYPWYPSQQKSSSS